MTAIAEYQSDFMPYCTQQFCAPGVNLNWSNLCCLDPFSGGFCVLAVPKTGGDVCIKYCQ